MATKVVEAQEIFIQRFLDHDACILANHEWEICKGVYVNLIDLVLPTHIQFSEDKSYLGFYPVGDAEFYMQIAYLPEKMLNNADAGGYKVYQLTFSPAFFAQWSSSQLYGNEPFKCDKSMEQTFSLNFETKKAFEIIAANIKNAQFLDLLYCTEASFTILRAALKAYFVPDEANHFPACSFLSNSNERDKVLRAHQIIMQNLETPLTIKELSKEVGINDCYLKKGFKALYGKTIHEYQQLMRIEKAKELLMQKDMTVNEVAFKMGFGSPSHFSTAFKKVAGIKPCELLA